MDQFSRDAILDTADAYARQRNNPRDSLFLAAELRVVGDPPIQVRVRNLSAGGLMAEYPRPVRLGDALDIDLRGIGWVRGRIAWAVEGRIGIAFEKPIDPLLARKPVGKIGKPRGK